MNFDLTVLILISGMALLSIVGFATTFLSILFISRDTNKISEIISRVSSIELMLTQLSEDVHLETHSSGEERWRTADGKYEGSSLEELIYKMSSDPNGPLNSEEIDALNSVFNKLSGGDKSEDTPPSPEPWK